MEHLHLQIPLAFGDLAFFRESGNLQGLHPPKLPKLEHTNPRPDFLTSPTVVTHL